MSDITWARDLAKFINNVRDSCTAHGGNDERVFSCMTSILLDYHLLTQGRDISAARLGAQIAEHG